MLQRGQRADHPVFVESVAPVSATVIRAVDAIEVPLAPLRGDRLGREHGMRVIEASDDPVRVDGFPVVERDAELRGDEGFLLSDYGRYLLLPEEKYDGFTPPERTIPADAVVIAFGFNASPEPWFGDYGIDTDEYGLVLASEEGDLAVVVVVTSLYPVATALLARTFLHERLGESGE